MASLIRKSGGIYQIQYTRNKHRDTLSLGSVRAPDAREAKGHVEAILAARWIGAPISPATMAWLARIDDALYGKLVKLGLVEPRARVQLKPFMEDYIASRTDVGKYTRINLNQASGKLVEFFGATTTIDTITRAEAKRWAREIVGADATRGRLILYARQFFKHAVESRLIAENPFRGIKAPAQRNPAKHFLIDPAVAQKVLDACPSAIWRLRFALARYGGLRTPLEARLLRWGDINWGLDRFAVRGKGGKGEITRYTPLFPEVHKALMALWDDNPPNELVLPKQTHAWNRDGLLKILASAGIVPWPRLWHNLRLTRHSELSAIYPRHIVCQWLGNSEQVADAHYTMVSDEQFKLASEGKTFAPASAPTDKLLQ